MLLPFILLISINSIANTDIFCSMEPSQGKIETSILDYSSKKQVIEKKAKIDPLQLVGKYGCGDGLGYNLSLELKPNGKFECVWYGCLGEYGKAQGEWEIDAIGIDFHNNTNQGLLKDRPMNRLRLASFQGHFLLLQTRDVTSFRSGGPSIENCLHTKKARKLVEEEGNRRRHEQFDQVLKILLEIKMLKEAQSSEKKDR